MIIQLTSKKGALIFINMDNVISITSMHRYNENIVDVTGINDKTSCQYIVRETPEEIKEIIKAKQEKQ